jgi:two-component system chemotaxis response regulator CheY
MNQSTIFELNDKIIDAEQCLMALSKDKSPLNTKKTILLLEELYNAMIVYNFDILASAYSNCAKAMVNHVETNLEVPNSIVETVFYLLDLSYKIAINNEKTEEETQEVIDQLIDGLTDASASNKDLREKAHNKQEKRSNVEDQIILFDDVPQPPEPEGPIPKKFLIADDEFANRLLLKRILESHGECDQTVDGIEVMEAFELALMDGRPYDAVFLDIMMPEMDGIEALKAIRHIEGEYGRTGPQEALVFMVTAISSPQMACKSFFKGYCTDYLVKPINTDKIVSKLKEYRLIDG